MSMAGLIDRITNDLREAMRGGDEIAVSTLRLVISNVKNAKIAKGSELSDEEVISVIAKDVKRHKESIAAFDKAKRGDLVQKEEAELAVLSGYLPTELPREEIAKVVEEVISQVEASGMQDMGRVMGQVMSRVKGQVDGADVLEIVKVKLSRFG